MKGSIIFPAITLIAVIFISGCINQGELSSPEKPILAFYDNVGKGDYDTAFENVVDIEGKPIPQEVIDIIKQYGGIKIPSIEFLENFQITSYKIIDIDDVEHDLVELFNLDQTDFEEIKMSQVTLNDKLTLGVFVTKQGQSWKILIPIGGDLLKQTAVEYKKITEEFRKKTAIILSIFEATCTGSTVDIILRNDGTTTSGPITVTVTPPDGLPVSTQSCTALNAGVQGSCSVTRGVGSEEGTYRIRVISSGDIPSSASVFCETEV